MEEQQDNPQTGQEGGDTPEVVDELFEKLHNSDLGNG